MATFIIKNKISQDVLYVDQGHNVLAGKLDPLPAGVLTSEWKISFVNSTTSKPVIEA